MNPAVWEKYQELLSEFIVKNTLELKEGKCACKICKKLFRSSEYLRLHFSNSHSKELKQLEEIAKNDQS